MSKKFIPNGDFDFAAMARGFAGAVAQERERVEVSAEDAEALTAAMSKYTEALRVCKYGERSAMTIRRKDDARAELEGIIRRIANAVRSNPRLDAVAKMAVGINPRSERPKVTPVPVEPPRLQFVRAMHQAGGNAPMHELSFYAHDLHAAKPAGAVRLELFVDLVPPGDPIPNHPGANHGSRPWYLRSYTRSPIKLVPPIASVPMRVVYWGRWADSMGNVGPFSATAVAWIEGGCERALPGGTGLSVTVIGAKKAVQILEIESPEQTPRPQYSVEVLQARYAALNPMVMQLLPQMDTDGHGSELESNSSSV